MPNTSGTLTVTLDDYIEEGRYYHWNLEVDLSYPEFVDGDVLYNYVTNYLRDTILEWWNNGSSTNKIYKDMCETRKPLESKYGKDKNINRDRIEPQDDDNSYYKNYIRYKAGCVMAHNTAPGTRAKSARIRKCFRDNSCDDF